MMRFLLAVLALVAGGCSTSGQDLRNPGDPMKLTYQGPEVQAALQQGANLHQLVVKVQAPSGGYRLWLEEICREGPAVAVCFTLESPGPEEAVTMALEEKQANVALKPEAAAVHIRVRQVQRNVKYERQPPAELARVLRRQ